MPILALHKPFDLVHGMVIDDLHSVGVGVVKSLLHSWFSVAKRKEAFSIYNKVVTSFLLHFLVYDVIFHLHVHSLIFVTNG